MIYYKKEFDIDRFEFWSGAYDIMKDATPEQIDAVKERIENYFYEETPTDTEINDLVWFECNDIFFKKEEDEEEEE